MEYFLFETYWGGIIFIFLGILLIFFTIKYADEKDSNSALQPYMHGIASGVGFILVGLIILYTTLFG